MEVRAQHQIIPFGDDLMHLVDSTTGQNLIIATRSGGVWSVKPVADGTAVEAADYPTRGDAITGMVNMALSLLGGTGYSTLVPHGLTERA